VLWVELLGGFRVLTDGRVSPRLPSARQQQLVAFLVLHARAAPIQRLRIAGSLWPESGDTQALTNLRRELYHLREAWPVLDGLVDAGSRTLAWRAEAGVVVDLVAFDAAAVAVWLETGPPCMKRHVCTKATSSRTVPVSGSTRNGNVSVSARDRLWHV
jgi:DNA-binding SARP family transcriptional activator